MRPEAPRLPLAPLLSLVHYGAFGATLTDYPGVPDLIVRLTGLSRRVAQRYSAAGEMPERHCDVAAATLGLHPLNIWPEWAELAKVSA